VGETLLNLRVLWMRLASIGRYLGADDQVEKEVHRADRRRRIIPFAAMVLIGIIGTLWWFGNDLRPPDRGSIRAGSGTRSDSRQDGSHPGPPHFSAPKGADS
jgi:hypothetical protein